MKRVIFVFGICKLYVLRKLLWYFHLMFFILLSFLTILGHYLMSCTIFLWLDTLNIILVVFWSIMFGYFILEHKRPFIISAALYAERLQYIINDAVIFVVVVEVYQALLRSFDASLNVQEFWGIFKCLEFEASLNVLEFWGIFKCSGVMKHL